MSAALATVPGIGFSGKNVEAQKRAAQQAAEMVTEVNRATEDALRAVITRAIKEGTPPATAAREIRGLVGLTTSQAQAVSNYRDRLEEMGSDPDVVDRMTDKYADKKLSERAENIARTETMDALNAGALEAWEQAQADGLLSEEALKEVIITYDEQTCPICSYMEGQQVKLSEPFVDEDGEEYDMPPFHPRCRCTAAAVEP